VVGEVIGKPQVIDGQWKRLRLGMQGGVARPEEGQVCGKGIGRSGQTVLGRKSCAANGPTGGRLVGMVASPGIEQHHDFQFSALPRVPLGPHAFARNHLLHAQML